MHHAMKLPNLTLIVFVLTLMALVAVGARADEDMDGLDLTMIVLDDVSDLDDAIAEMGGPDDDGVKDVDWEYEYEEDSDDNNDKSEARDRSAERFEDQFDDEFEGDVENEEEAFGDEDDFEDGEDVDDDAFDDKDG